MVSFPATTTEGGLLNCSIKGIVLEGSKSKTHPCIHPDELIYEPGSDSPLIQFRTMLLLQRWNCNWKCRADSGAPGLLPEYKHRQRVNMW